MELVEIEEIVKVHEEDLNRITALLLAQTQNAFALTLRVIELEHRLEIATATPDDFGA